MESDFNRLISLLNEVLLFVNRPGTDVVWADYDNVGECKKEIFDCQEKLRKKDIDVLKKLRLLFAPTGAFQEISLSNGWGDEFLEISSRYDDLEERILNQKINS